MRVRQSRVEREMWFLYAVRNGAEHIWNEPLAQIAATHPSVHLVVCYSQPGADDEAMKPRGFHRAGRLDLAALKEILPNSEAEFYLCGPPAMIGAITGGLKEWGVPDSRINLEAFGAATVQKANNPNPDTTSRGVKVKFARSGRSAAWMEDSGSLLDFAEKHGVAINSGCRAGNCGTCLVALKEGEVTYLREPGVTVESGSCLPCIAVPKTAVSLDA